MRILKLYPLCEACSIEARLSKTEVIKRVRNLLSEEKPVGSIMDLLSRLPSAPFVGTVHEDGFRITRKPVMHGNSFYPVMQGTLEEKNGKTVVSITMTPRPFVTAFMTFYL